MLHAFSGKKSQLYKRYLGHREAGEKRVCEEDEITALIMGPLDFLPACAAGAFWKAVIEKEAAYAELPFPAGPPRQASMHFWPRQKIEPDLLVELTWPDGERRILLIEFKWNAPLSGQNQLQRQWTEYLTCEQRRIAYHLFIAPDLSEGFNALGQDNVWKGRLVLRSWVTILETLQGMNGLGGTGFERWKHQVSTVLGLLSVKRFQGFEGLRPYPLPPAGPCVFWSPVRGVGRLRPPHFSRKETQPKHVFWRAEHE